jgi:hypothetical protein
MPPSERPPPSSDHPPPFDDDDEEARADTRDGRRRLVQRIIEKGVRRAVEKGVERITETPEDIRQFVQDLKLPREVGNLLFNQIDETKNGLYRATAKELRDFLEQTNIAEEIVRALTTLSFEIKTEIRFIPNDSKADGKLPKPDVKATVRIKDPKPEPSKSKERDPLRDPKDEDE